MTDREAKRIALRNIVVAVRADILRRSSSWAVHPDKGSKLAESDAAQIERAAHALLAVMERRAGRLRSVGGFG